MTRFARDLHAALTGGDRQPANLVFSPASIAIALAMVREGAGGTTAEQIDSLLTTDDRAALMHSVHALTAAAGPDADLALSIVSSLFVQRDYQLRQRFVDALRSRFDTTPELVDYAADPELARARINAWVDDVTRHRISALLAPGALSIDTRLTVVNAIYMKAAWRHPFSPAATRPAAFTCADGSVRDVSTMHLTATLPYAAGDGWQCLEMPYAATSLSMLVVLPEPGRTVGRGIELATEPIELLPTRVAVALPRFDVSTSASLTSALAALGMTDAFDLTTADFREITTSEPMCIGEVVHQANLTADEDGTEAAAATAFGLAGSGLQTEPPVPFRADRPFAFAVRDRSSAAVLFLGHVGAP